MSERKIGIAVSMYDKFDDLELLVEILRENFDQDYYIAVSSQYEDFQPEMEDREIDVDEIVEGEDIFYSPKMKQEGHRGQINLSSRILNSFKESCLSCIESGCDYVMHVHADAWPMDEESLNKIIDEMQERDRSVALRGRGSSYRKPDHWMGFIMDQFLIIDSEAAKEKCLFDFNSFDLFPHASIHNSILMLLIGKMGRSNIYYYSDMSQDRHWDGKKVYPPFTTVRPSIKVPDYDLVHVATESFPEERLGKAVQAKYLDEYNLESDKIYDFIEKYSMEQNELDRRLHMKEKEQNRKLRLLGFEPKMIGRNFDWKEEILDSSLKEKLGMLIKNILKGVYYRSHEIFFKYSPIKDNNFTGGRRCRYLYKDSEWPNRSMSEIYRESVNENDFPEEYRKNFWFK